MKHFKGSMKQLSLLTVVTFIFQLFSNSANSETENQKFGRVIGSVAIQYQRIRLDKKKDLASLLKELLDEDLQVLKNLIGKTKREDLPVFEKVTPDSITLRYGSELVTLQVVDFENTEFLLNGKKFSLGFDAKLSDFIHAATKILSPANDQSNLYLKLQEFVLPSAHAIGIGSILLFGIVGLIGYLVTKKVIKEIRVSKYKNAVSQCNSILRDNPAKPDQFKKQGTSFIESEKIKELMALVEKDCGKNKYKQCSFGRKLELCHKDITQRLEKISEGNTTATAASPESTRARRPSSNSQARDKN